MNPNMTRTGLFETPKSESKSEPGFSSRPSISEPPRTKLARVTPKIGRGGRSSSKAESAPRVPADQSTGSVASGDRSPRSVASLDRSPRSIDSKPLNLSTNSRAISDRQSRAVKKSDLQAELNAAKEELKEANEHLVYLEKEKARALEELQEAKRQADEAFEQLTVAIAAKKEAEEKIEIEKFRIVELEQSGIEAARQREETWQKEIESVRKQHEDDVSALLAATQELERMKHELVMTTEARNAATAHAEDALKIAEIHGEKASMLSTEVNRLRALLDSKLETTAKETAEHARRLEVEIDGLRDEVRIGRQAEKKLSEMEDTVKDLRVQIADARKSKSAAEAQVIEWKKKAELLEAKVDEAIQSEKSASKSLASALKQLEDCNASLKEAESEIAFLKGKVATLETEISRHKESLEQSDKDLEAARSEISELERVIPSLKSKIRSEEEEKNRALGEKARIASSIPTLVEENKKLALELKASKDEAENAKKAMEGMTSALQEARSEVKISKEQLRMKQAEVADAKTEIDDMKKTLKSTEENYKGMLFEALNEVTRLKAMIEGSATEARSVESDRKAKEENYVKSVRISEEEISGIKGEMDKLVYKLGGSEKEVAAAKEERAKLVSRLEQATQMVKLANDAADGARAESLQLKGRLQDKENELQNITRENDELRIREEEVKKKILELSMKLEDALAKKEKENAVVSRGKNVHNVVPMMARFSADVEPLDEEKLNTRERVGNGNQNKPYTKLEYEDEDGDDMVNKILSPEKESEPAHLSTRPNSKLGNETPDSIIEEMTPSTEQHEKRRRFFKLGSLLKKKNHPK